MNTRATEFVITVQSVDPDAYSCEVDGALGSVPGHVLSQCTTRGDFDVIATVPGGLRNNIFEYIACANCLPHVVRELEKEKSE